MKASQNPIGVKISSNALIFDNGFEDSDPFYLPFTG